MPEGPRFPLVGVSEDTPAKSGFAIELTRKISASMDVLFTTRKGCASRKIDFFAYGEVQRTKRLKTMNQILFFKRILELFFSASMWLEKMA